MRTHLVATTVFALALSASPAAESPAPLEPLDRTLLSIRVNAAVLETFDERDGRLPPPHMRLVAVDSVGATLGKDLARELAPRNGWGHPIRLLIVDATTWLLISYGADGSPDRDYLKDWDSGGGEAGDEEELDPFSLDRDFVFNGDFLQRPRRPESSVERALADLQAIGTAIESYAVDHNKYPGPTEGLVPVDRLVRNLEPFYIRSLPRVDPWGLPYLVCSDGTSYALVSGGPGRTLEFSYTDVRSVVADIGPAVVSLDVDDIVFVNGQFVTWPAESSPGAP